MIFVFILRKQYEVFFVIILMGGNYYMKFPRKCIDCGRLATERVLFYGKNRHVCNECAKEFRRKGGIVPKTEKKVQAKTETIRKPVPEEEIDLAILTEPEFKNEFRK